MSVNLFDMFQDAIGDNLVNQASSLLGESKENTSSAMDSVLPALMGSLINKGGDADGATGLLDFLGKNNFDGGLLDNLGGLFGGGSATDGLLSSGSGVLKFLLGDKLSGVVDLISGGSGIKTSNAGSLLKMASPLLMSVVGKYLKNNALDAIGLSGLLLGQRDELKKRSSGGLGDLLGFSALDKLGGSVTAGISSAADTAKAAVDDTASAVTDAAGDIADTGKSVFGRLLPWLVLAIAAIGLLWLLNRMGCNAAGDVGDKIEQTTDSVADAAKEGAKTVGDAASSTVEAAAEAIRSISIPGGAEIKASANSFIAKIADLLSVDDADYSKPLSFDGVSFRTGTANLTRESAAELGDLVQILNAYPNVKLRVEGHTDNTGNAENNKTLSQQRAMAVKNWLGQKGIAADRVEAIGRGQDAPIADNNTEEGRSQNRRVEVYITAH